MSADATDDVLLDVSLIIPVYNVADYVPECFASVVDQAGFSSLEVIVVDDGSTDESEALARKFAADHPNVRLIRQENSGLGAARNTGLTAATRDFVAFLDSDDVLPPAALNSLRACVREGVDVVVGRMETFPKHTAWPWLRELQQGFRVLDSLAEAPTLIHSASACNKLFRRRFLSDQELMFGVGVHFEDVYVTVPALMRARKIALTDELVYRYRKRHTGGSIMDSLFDRQQNYWDHLRVEETLHALLPELDEERALMLREFMVRSFQGFAMRAADVLPGDQLAVFFRRAQRVYQDFPIDVLRESAIDARHRVAYAAFVRDDYELFSEKVQTRRRVKALDGALVLDRYATDDPVQDLLKLDRVSAWVESVQVRREGTPVLVVRGRFSVPGLDLSTEPTFELGLRVRGSGVTVPAVATQRSELGDRYPEQRYSGFEAVVPLSRLRSGEHHLRLVFMTSTGQASTRTRPSQGYLRGAREISHRGLRLIPRVDRWDNCQVWVQRGRGRRSRWKWRMRLLRHDVALVTQLPRVGLTRCIRALSRPIFRQQSVWILGERRNTAQDNSFALFKHLRSVSPERRAFYILDRDAPMFDSLRAEWGRNVVAHSSWLHRLLMLHAAVIIGSYDIDGYLLPAQWKRDHYQRHLAWRIGSRRAFLQHGVIYNDVSAALHKGITGLDMFVASSPREAAFIRERMGYEGEVAVTGLPRFDGLHLDTRREGGRRVLFMPTWRVYLVSPSYAQGRQPLTALEGSDYLRFLRGVLEHPRLHSALDRHDAVLELLPHYEIAQYGRDLLSAHPRITFSDQRHRNVQEAIKECDLFVTDWSSTFFDAAYLGKPVVHAPFDEEQFYGSHYRKGYFDLEVDGFGPVCRTVDETVAAVERYLDNGCVREDVYDRKASDFFPHRDQSNAARAVVAIDAVLKGETPSTAVEALD